MSFSNNITPEFKFNTAMIRAFEILGSLKKGESKFLPPDNSGVFPISNFILNINDYIFADTEQKIDRSGDKRVNDLTGVSQIFISQFNLIKEGKKIDLDSFASKAAKILHELETSKLPLENTRLVGLTLIKILQEKYTEKGTVDFHIGKLSDENAELFAGGNLTVDQYKKILLEACNPKKEIKKREGDDISHLWQIPMPDPRLAEDPRLLTCCNVKDLGNVENFIATYDGYYVSIEDFKKHVLENLDQYGGDGILENGKVVLSKIDDKNLKIPRKLIDKNNKIKIDDGVDFSNTIDGKALTNFDSQNVPLFNANLDFYSGKTFDGKDVFPGIKKIMDAEIQKAVDAKIDDYKNTVWDLLFTEVQDGIKNKVEFLGGPPGAGKSSSLKNIPDHELYYMVTRDELRYKFFTHNVAVALGQHHDDYKYIAAATDVFINDELSKIVKTEYPIIRDGTMQALKHIEALLKVAAAGRKCAVHITLCSPYEIAIDRMHERFEKTNRAVPPEIAIQALIGVTSQLMNFARYPSVKKLKIYDNSVADKEAVLIAETDKIAPHEFEKWKTDNPNLAYMVVDEDYQHQTQGTKIKVLIIHEPEKLARALKDAFRQVTSEGYNISTNHLYSFNHDIEELYKISKAAAEKSMQSGVNLNI
jgi:predicted ABC-type ATPase